MKTVKVIVTRRLPQAVEQKLQHLFDVTLNHDDHSMSVTELQHAVKTADALCPTVTDKINAEVLGVAAPQVRLIANFGVGFNHIDVAAAHKAGMAVTNTPGVLTDCTADIAMTLILMAARRAGEGERHVRSGNWTSWRPTHMLGTRVSGKTLGLIGMGRIGLAVAHRAHHGFGMQIIYCNRSPIPEPVRLALNAKPCNSIEELLQQADFVSLHCPGGAATRHLINTERLALMKPGAFLINTARGDVIDEAALIKALANGTIAGAGLDVYANEPQVPEELLSMENAVLLPHLGSATTETRVAMGMRMVDNLEAFFSGKQPLDIVTN